MQCSEYIHIEMSSSNNTHRTHFRLIRGKSVLTADDSFSALLTHSAPCRRRPSSRHYNILFCNSCHHKTMSISNWLVIPECIQFHIAVAVHRCLNGLASAYLTELCNPVTQNRLSCRLRSSYCHRLAVPSVKLSIGSRSFSVSGPTVWNALPDYLRNPTLPTDVFKSYLKTFLFAHY